LKEHVEYIFRVEGYAGFVLALFFDPSDGGDSSKTSVWLSTDYTTLYHRRKNSSKYILLQ
jgi:hypothetical protein